MEVRILGALQVVHRGAVVELGRPQRRALVAALAVRANQVVAADRLVDDLWSERPPPRAEASLRAQVSHVRRALAEAGAGEPLVSRRPGYVLRLGPDELDAWRFERLVADGRAQLAAGAFPEAVATLRAGLALWRGAALADVADAPFATADAVRLDEARLNAVEDLVEARLGAGDHHALIGDLRRLVAEQPLRERLWSQLILALYRAGRQGEALRAYSDLRRTLADELGIGPSPTLQRLEDAVLRQDPGIAWEPSSPAVAPPGAGGRRVVPSRVSSFVGRTRELAEVQGLLADARLVTLSGPGGCGKTRLAIEVAAGGEGPATLVELAAVGDPDLVEGAVARSLGVPEDPGRTIVESLQVAVGAGPLLLVLDGCEHVVGAAARLAEQLLGRCPGLHVLATSRHRLGITGERVWTVPALALPADDDRSRPDWWASEAVRLFEERARALKPDFSVDEGNAEAVASVCQRLDGLPLAIELAAARVAVLSVEELRARVSDSLALLTGGSSAGPFRQQTLRATVEWSYRSLSPNEKALFARLSVFCGGFGVQAAEAVGAATPGPTPAEVLESLAELVDSSMVARLPDRLGAARFRLLETLQHHASERLVEEGAVAVTARRHAQWCLDLVSQAERRLRGPQQRAALALLDLESANLRAALDWAGTAGECGLAGRLGGALWWYWFRRGRLREGRDQLARLLALDELGSEDRRLVLSAAAYLAWVAADVGPAASLSRQALVLAEDGGVAPPCLALVVAGLVASAGGDLEGARTRQEEALRLYRAASDDWGEAWVLRHLCGTAYRRGDLVEAAFLAEDSRARFLAVGDDWGAAGSGDAMASLARERGDLEAARTLGDESIELHRTLGEGVGLAIALHHQAELLLQMGDAAGAATLARESMALDRQHGDEEDLAATSALLADIEARIGAPEGV